MKRNILTALLLPVILTQAVMAANEKIPADPEPLPYAAREAELTNIKNPLQLQYMKEWIEITRGENIALGKSITASIAPNYEYAPNNKLENLLDGRLSKREDGKLLFAPEAFAWTTRKGLDLFSRGIWIMLDLKDIHPVKTIAMRVMGGGKTTSQQVPGRIGVLASEDGTSFYEVETFHKLGPNEAEADDGERLVHLEETGNNFVYPVRFSNLHIRARYLVFQISLTSTFFADEIAVVKGDFDPAGAALPPERKRIFIPQGYTFYPNKSVLAVTRQVLTPNFFDLIDDRTAEERKQSSVYCLELPAFLEILKHSPAMEIISVEDLPSGRRKWSLRGAAYFLGGKIGPLYFRVAGKAEAASGEKAVFYIESEGREPKKVEVPVQLLDVPRAATFKNFHVSLGWLNDSDRMQWPSFLEAYDHLGFNAVPTFSYHYLAKAPPPKVDKQAALVSLQEARQRGFKILQIEPSFHLMYSAAAGNDEIYSQLENPDTPNRTQRTALCPAYRGTYYQQEIQRFAEAVKTICPDLIFHDIECWGWGCRYADKCKTCLDYKAKLGIESMEEFIFSMGREHMADLEASIAGLYPGKDHIPPCGIYGLRSKRTLGADWNLHSWEKLHPDYVSFSQPSLYTGGDVMRVHQTLLEEFKAAGKRITIPWLTPGCPVEFDPRKIEPMLYAAFLDGVAGITYYAFFDFDTPLDFYYHAKAIATLAPHEELLRSGTVAPVVCDNSALLTSAWNNPETGSLVLLYNHVSRKTEKAVWSLPGANPGKRLKNLLTGITSRAEATNALSLPPGECALFLLDNE